ncbi:MAG: DUF1405 domain-containing protein [Candidatus Hodarchaeales archaeon]
MKTLFRPTFDRIKAVELKLFENRLLLVALIVGNALGAIIGFFYYIDVIGISHYPILLWILIPDCPMGVLLLVGVFIQGREQRFKNYNYFVFVQGIRGAVFTYLIIILFGSLDVFIVVVGHTLLLLQAILILPLVYSSGWNKRTLFPIILTFFNDFSDFFGLWLFTPTLAQLPTIQPLFAFYFIAILSLDILTISTGLWVMRKREMIRTSGIKP